MEFTAAEPQSPCIQCRYSLTPKDWTCPRCGAIVDRYLFSTITRESLEGDSLNAFESCYRHCRIQKQHTGSTTIRPEAYRPVPRCETAYRAGWQCAADELSARADRKFGRRRGAIVLGSGVAAIGAGLVLAYVTNWLSGGSFMFIWETLFGAGAVSVAIGLGMLVTGSGDEVRPDAE